VLDQHEKETKLKNWISDVDSEPPITTPLPRPTSKPVDEDLYKISPGLLYAKAKKVQPHTPFAFLSEFFLGLSFQLFASFDKVLSTYQLCFFFLLLGAEERAVFLFLLLVANLHCLKLTKGSMPMYIYVK